MDLKVGVALTAEQMASLTTDIVWLVEEVVNGEKVLVPIVFTSSLEGDHFNGAIGSTLLIDEAELIYRSEN